MMRGDVLRWVNDDEGHWPLASQLRTRPGAWAIIDQGLNSHAARRRVDGIREGLGRSFEAEARPYDDGPNGVLYEIAARYAPDPDD